MDECWCGIGGWCECALGCGRDTVWRWGAFVIGIGRDTGCRWGAFGMGGGDADHWSDDDDDPQDLWYFTLSFIDYQGASSGSYLSA